jgi:hypothetical protein
MVVVFAVVAAAGYIRVAVPVAVLTGACQVFSVAVLVDAVLADLVGVRVYETVSVVAVRAPALLGVESIAVFVVTVTLQVFAVAVLVDIVVTDLRGPGVNSGTEVVAVVPSAILGLVSVIVVVYALEGTLAAVTALIVGAGVSTLAAAVTVGVQIDLAAV